MLYRRWVTSNCSTMTIQDCTLVTVLLGRIHDAVPDRSIASDYAQSQAFPTAAESKVFSFIPAGSDAEIQPTMCDVVNGGSHVRKDCWMTIGIAGDHDSEPQSVCLGSKGCQQGPPF